ncbi:hypothetical protein C0J52_01241 [Blattella germanica]|nr:hypothetical protein C0J52_01241 [Blattella germanica]
MPRCRARRLTSRLCAEGQPPQSGPALVVAGRKPSAWVSALVLGLAWVSGRRTASLQPIRASPRAVASYSTKMEFALVALLKEIEISGYISLRVDTTRRPVLELSSRDPPAARKRSFPWFQIPLPQEFR